MNPYPKYIRHWSGLSCDYLENLDWCVIATESLYRILFTAVQSNVWFYRDRTGATRGPAHLGTLRQCWVNGIVDEHTMMWGNGLQDWLPVRNIRGLIPNIRNPPTIFMHWLMRKFVDTDAKLEVVRRKRFDHGEAKTDTLKGEDVRKWNTSRERELRRSGTSLTG